jgi:hypothetical protein
MFRRIVAMVMMVSFVALATSGAMMFVIERPSFTIQMHPVHKFFGLLMVICASAHITLNFRAIKSHLRFRSAMVTAAIAGAVLMVMYGMAVNRPVPPELAKMMDDAAAKVESAKR